MLRNLNDLEIFVSVAEHKSFTAAARAVQLSASAVSKYVASLEESLGAPLLNRSTHHLVLTEAGTAFYNHCLRVLAELDEARNEVRRLHEEVSGHLRIFAPLCVGQNLIAPAIADFMARNPGVSVELMMNPGAMNLLEHRLDVVIRSKRSRTTDHSVVHRKLGSVPYAVCASPAYFAGQAALKAPSDLAGRNCLIHTTQDDASKWRFRIGTRIATLTVEGNFRSNNSAAVRTAALSGLGIARLPRYLVAEDLAHGRLISLFEGSVQSDRLIAAYYPRSRSAPAKVRSLLDHLAEYCARHCATAVAGRGKLLAAE